MENLNGDPVYSVSVEDLNNVANDLLGRDLTPDEATAVADRLGDFMPWYEAICNTIQDCVPQSEFIDESVEE